MINAFLPRPFEVLSLGTIQPRGWIAAQLQRDLSEGFAGQLDRLTPHVTNDLFANQIHTSREQYAWWDSETRGNWLWGYVMMAHLSHDPSHVAHAQTLLEALKATQDSDGYIGIYSPEWRYNHPDGENGELWGQSRALLPMLAHYEFSHDISYLTAVERAVQLTMRQYHRDRPYFRRLPDNRAVLTGLTHGLCYVDVVEWLYRLTGNAAYRDYGVWLYEDFCRMVVPFENDDLALKNLQEKYRYFGGHAVHTVEHLRALLFAVAMSDMDSGHQLYSALQNAFYKFEHYQLPSGAIAGDEGIHGLPNPDSGYEYCTLTEWLWSLTSALEKTGNARYGDWIETVAFNAGQGSRLADGSGLGYLSSDTRLNATARRPDSYSYLHNWAGRFKYSPTHEDVACCCNPNAVRFMPHYLSRMWMRHADGVAAVTYGPSAIDTMINGVRVMIEEETSYPFDHTITFIISPADEVTFSVWLRKPGWADAMIIQADGAVIDETLSDKTGFVSVYKHWQYGDTITVTFSAQVALKPYPNAEFSINWGALQFALPIVHRLTPTKDYPVASLHDYDVTLIDPAGAYQPLILNAALPSYGLQLETFPGEHSDYPWDNSPVRLRAGDMVLLPLGATVLRRASFPLHALPKTANP